MPLLPLQDLPDTARLWVFPSSRSLSHEEVGVLLERMDGFLEGWAAHGEPLLAGREWRDGRFLLVAVDDASVPPSGCSIDDLARELKEAGRALEAEFLDRSSVWYEEGEEVRSVSREAFKALVARGAVTLESPVFDPSLVRLGQLRNGEWKKPAGASWHRRAFFSGV